MTRQINLRTKLMAAATFAAASVALLQPAAAVEKGEHFVTQGLVCDRPSYVDAVVTLAYSGEDFQAAVAQVNSGSEKPRCLAGLLIVARYVGKARTFFMKDNAIHVHKVKVIGVAASTPQGVVPQRLDEPVTQYVFTIEKAAGA